MKWTSRVAATVAAATLTAIPFVAAAPSATAAFWDSPSTATNDAVPSLKTIARLYSQSARQYDKSAKLCARFTTLPAGEKRDRAAQRATSTVILASATYRTATETAVNGVVDTGKEKRLLGKVDEAKQKAAAARSIALDVCGE